MQTTLHQNPRTAQIDGLLNFVEDHVFRMQVTLGVSHRPVKCAEAAIFCAEIRVIDVAIDDVADDSVRMQLAPHGVGCHADAHQIVAAIQVDCFLARHHTQASSFRGFSNLEACSRNAASPAYSRDPNSNTMLRVKYSRASASEIPSFGC